MKNFKNHFNHIEDARYSVGALSAFRSVNAQDVIFKVPGDNRQFQQVASFSAHSIDAALDGLFDEQFNPKQVQFIRVTQFRKDMNGRNQENAEKIFPYGCALVGNELGPAMVCGSGPLVSAFAVVV